MGDIPKISLEQWATFKAVVDEGSFALAAEYLNKSQSSVSYTLARMEEQLPTPVLKQEGRKAALTEAGKVLYRQAVQLLGQAEELERSASYLASGWEAEVSLAVDALVCVETVFCALNTFSQNSPGTRIKIFETTLSGTEERILSRDVDLAITAHVPPGFLSTFLTNTRMIPVAKPGHAIFDVEAPISESELKRHRQIVIRDSGSRREQDAGWLAAEQRWTVSHFSSSIEAVRAGLGFAFIPEEKIHHLLNSGELKPLVLAFGAERVVPLNLVLTDQSRAGPATKAVADAIIKKIK